MQFICIDVLKAEGIIRKPKLKRKVETDPKDNSTLLAALKVRYTPLCITVTEDSNFGQAAQDERDARRKAVDEAYEAKKREIEQDFAGPDKKKVKVQDRQVVFRPSEVIDLTL